MSKYINEVLDKFRVEKGRELIFFFCKSDWVLSWKGEEKNEEKVGMEMGLESVEGGIWKKRGFSNRFG